MGGGCGVLRLAPSHFEGVTQEEMLMLFFIFFYEGDYLYVSA
jgi:hypothetical protein